MAKISGDVESKLGAGVDTSRSTVVVWWKGLGLVSHREAFRLAATLKIAQKWEYFYEKC